MSDYRKLAVWAKAHQLTLAVYRATVHFPKEEIYGLTGQIRRAAASIPAKIAEGSGRGSNPEFIRFLRIANGSANELEYHLLLAHDLGLLETKAYQELDGSVKEVGRMLAGLMRHLQF